MIASFSGGKDSTAMVLRLIEDKRELDEVVFYDTGAEFEATYRVVEQVKQIVESSGIKFTTLSPNNSFWFDMLIRPVNHGKPNEHYGYEWCGGCTRWGTQAKLLAINKYANGKPQYVGIAYDESERAKGKLYPLIEWKMTESDCLKYCRSRGISWEQEGIDLYDILDRVSCWCCGNKNLKELRNIYHKLPYTWSCLRGIQSRIDRPFHNGKTIYELESRFEIEDRQQRLF